MYRACICLTSVSDNLRFKKKRRWYGLVSCLFLLSLIFDCQASALLYIWWPYTIILFDSTEKLLERIYYRKEFYRFNWKNLIKIILISWQGHTFYKMVGNTIDKVNESLNDGISGLTFFQEIFLFFGKFNFFLKNNCKLI